MSRLRLFLVLATLCSARANFDMDPVRDPVMQRLNIPAQVSNDFQDLQSRGDGNKHLPDVTVEAGRPFVINLPFHAANVEVSGRDGKPLPPWIVYDKTSNAVRGQPAESDSGDWSVQVGKAKNAFTIRVRRQIGEDDGSGDDDYEEISEDSNEDLEESPVAPSFSTPILSAQSTPVLQGSSRMEPAAKPRMPAIEVTKIVTSRPTETVEPTPLVTFDSGARISDDASNSSLFDAEPTSGLDPSFDADIAGRNTISEEDDDNSEKKEPLPPVVNRRLQKIAATAGKVFRYPVPADTFSNTEDGSRNLHLELLTQDGKPIAEDSWIGFDSVTKEIYGLPLADDIGKYTFLVQARNSANLTVSEAAEIQVRQHPSERAFNHRFTLQLEPEFSDDERILPPIHWLLKTVSAIANATGSKDDVIVVRKVEGEVKDGHAFNITWSNDSLPRTHCAEDEIQEIFELLYNKQLDVVTDGLDNGLSPQLSVTLGILDLDGICQPMPTTSAPVPGSETKPPKKANRAPEVTNQVDHLEAEVGKLFHYKVPADTFFDEEDGNTPMLKLTLQKMDLQPQPLNPRSWLQFDVPNQEFYGLPLDEDAGTEEYQLVCTDSSGASTTDGLEVFVNKRSDIADQQPLVEFALTIDVDYDAFIGSAHRKVRFVKAIVELFNDPDARYVDIQSITPGSTVVRWANTTLTGTTCPPNAEIVNLRRVVMDDEGKLTQRCIDIFSAEDFKPLSASVNPMSSCIGDLTPTTGPGTSDVKEQSEDNSSNSMWSDDYLLTFIVPGIIITVMLLLAAVIACILYRRRRTGKLGLEEHRSFVSKGIPIIFAEELEERPSGRHPAKAPVILKEEKPSQPPDYHRVRSSASPFSSHKPAEQHDLLRTPSDDNEDEPASLYQPPPPLSSGRDSTSSRYSRPKATPAYRKPPPYVPP